jgi:AcrR family transcriptional regulator
MTPRSPKQYHDIREEKRTLIMDVALKHFAEKGYHITTISHIAKHAGISKGLIYNYFESKEQLLTEIIDRSMGEVARYLDPDNDGLLSQEEFELFVRKLFLILREKISFWRLFYQLLMQNEVRSQLLKTSLNPFNAIRSVNSDGDSFIAVLTRLIADYFLRNKERRDPDYDPLLEMNMFIYTIEGFAMITLYQEEIDDRYYQKAINKIIELYK